MSAEIFNIFSPAKEISFQKQNRTEKSEDIVDTCAVLRWGVVKHTKTILHKRKHDIK